MAEDQDEANDPKSKKNKRRRRLLWLLLFIVIVIWFATQNGGSDDSSTSTTQPEINGKTSQSSTPVYEGCDGLADLIPKLIDDGSLISLQQAVNVGSDAACDKVIEGWNKSEYLKD